MKVAKKGRFSRRIAAVAATSALALSGLVTVNVSASAADAAADCAPSWDAGQVYTGGMVASFGGANYSAKWWSLGEQPSSANQWGAWKLDGPCGDSGNDDDSGSDDSGSDDSGSDDSGTDDDGTTCTAAWDPSAVFTGGQLVSYDGANYRARWWTQGEQPSTANTWGVWQFVEDCGTTTPGDDDDPGDGSDDGSSDDGSNDDGSDDGSNDDGSDDGSNDDGSDDGSSEDDDSGDDDPVVEAPVAPTGVSASKVTTGGVTLVWTAVDGAETYTVYVGSSVAADLVSGTSANIAGLDPDTTYTFTVTATNQGGTSPASAALTVRTAKPTDDPGDGNDSGEDCRPDGLYQTPGVDVPYCDVYDAAGREILPNDLDRRVIGYFTSWRDGTNGAPQYLASDIPWDKISHINYAFAHIDSAGKVSVNQDVAGNAATDETWPGNPAASMDTSLPYQGHFNLLEKYKKANPGVKTLISVGGWAETGGYLVGDDRVADGGFYKMTQSQASIDTFADSAVQFIRQYGFDGVDIDYEYATSNSKAGNPDDFWIAEGLRGSVFKNYEALMKTLRIKLDQAAAEDGKYYMLTVAAPASGWLLRGMETYQMVQYLDYVNIMSYDLHGAWNNYVGGLAALFDDGKDAELAAGGVYGAYQGMGYLNTDWAYHYFRGAMQAGRINIGVPFYTRGWQGITGGTNGMGGKAALPDQSKCPPGTGSNIGSNTPCGYGGTGIENVWHDSDPQGAEVPSGVNPIWHALNLQQGIPGSYLDDYGVTEKSITGTYTHHFDPVSKIEWWYNSAKKSLITGDSDAAITAKADYVADKGIGGVMIWELAGDYAWDAGAGEYGMGDTLVTILHDKLSNTTPYGATKANVTMPTEAIQLDVKFDQFALGDNNYPINPRVTFYNNSSVAIPAGSTIEFDYATSNITMGEQNGWGLTSIRDDHTGPNVGGIKGDFHTVSLKVPSGGIPAGGSNWTKLSWSLPMTSISNLRITINGTTYAATYDNPRGVTVVNPGSDSTDPGDTTDPGDSTNPGDGGGDPGQCTGAAWDPGQVYTGGAKVYKDGTYYTARYWTQGNDPATSGEWGPWARGGSC